MQVRQLLTSVFELVKTIAIVFLIAFVIRQFLIQSFRVEGSSMEPNFHSGEFLLVEKVSYRLRQASRGDVIILKSPEQPTVDFIKRIIGLPGETVAIHDERVFINGTMLQEPYLNTQEVTKINGSSAENLTISVPDDHVFVLGDNRQSSKDSRSIGTIPRDNIVGRSFLVIWPAENFGLVPAATPPAR